MLSQLILFGSLAILSCQAAVQPLPKLNLISDEELAKMLHKFPELEEKFDAYNLEYSRYLSEVSEVLVQDPGMREHLDSQDNPELAMGYVAEELHKLNPELRSKLDEIKRKEIRRLTDAFEKAEKENKSHNIDVKHLDWDNTEVFGVNDFRYILKQTVHDLNEMDEMRRKLFKEHEMKKEFEKKEKLKIMSEEQKQKFLAEESEKKKQRLEREKGVLHPGSEKQFEEVWKKDDQMTGQKFNPTTFFLMHDLNGDEMLDEMEVKALFAREVNKIFENMNATDIDPLERDEELELMREHYMGEADVNKDRMITMHEFVKHTKRKGYTMEEGWHSEYNNYTKEELEEFEKDYREYLERLRKRKAEREAAAKET